VALPIGLLAVINASNFLFRDTFQKIKNERLLSGLDVLSFWLRGSKYKNWTKLMAQAIGGVVTNFEEREQNWR
jgi:hypothetical protein